MKDKIKRESLKFHRKDGKLYSPYNKASTNEQHRKHRNKVKAALAAGTAVVGIGGGIGIGYAIWHSQNNQPEPIPPTPTPTIVKTLNIEGTRDLAVPYRTTYKYQCNGATLTAEELPDIFKFENNILTYTASTTPATSGTFKLKATANDGSGKTKTITIFYYGVSSINENKCRFLYSGGRVSADQDLTIADGTLALSLSDDDRKLLKAVYFGELSDDITKIDSSFLQNCPALTTVDLTQFADLTITSIGNYFLFQCRALTTIDLSGLTNLTTIGDNFLANCNSISAIELPSSLESIGTYFLSQCRSITSIDLPSSLTEIGIYFLQNCYAITSLDLSTTAVTKIGTYFLSNCSALTSITLPFSLTTIGDNFLSSCTALTSISLPSSLTTIGNYFLLQCSALTSIDLSPLTALTKIGTYFLRNCTAITSVTVGDNDFSRSTLSFGDNPMNGITNLITNKIIGAKAAKFRSAIGDAISA
jgi:hypothetical protein